jgi:hypothetical protein
VARYVEIDGDHGMQGNSGSKRGMRRGEGVGVRRGMEWEKTDDEVRRGVGWIKRGHNRSIATCMKRATTATA